MSLWTDTSDFLRAWVNYGRERIRQRFSVPSPETEDLKAFLHRISGFKTSTLPADRAMWLSLLTESPYLSAPLRVWRDQFAGVQFVVMRPTSRSAGTNARRVASLDCCSARHDMVSELEDKGDLVPLDPEHPLHNLLYRNVPRWTGKTWRGMAVQHRLVVGESFLRLGRKHPLAPPSSGLTIVPTDVFDVPKRPDEGYRIRGEAGETPASEIFEWSEPDPKTVYGRGRGLAQALGDELESAEFLMRWFRSYFLNDGTPSFIFMFRGQETVREMRRKLDRGHRGWRKSFRGHIMKQDSDGGAAGPVKDQFSFQQVADSLDPAKATEFSAWVSEFVRKHLGVPPSMMGDFEQSATKLGMSGVRLESFVFQDTRLTPEADSFVDAFQDLVRREVDERLVVGYVPFMEQDRDYRLKAMEAFPDLYTNDEKRAVSGHPPLEDRVAGESFMVKEGQVIVADLRPGNPALEGSSGQPLDK